MASESGERRGPKPPTTTAGGVPPPPPSEQEHLPCPRCDSTHTKFCYYNNYNFSQPRHFCKSCRRYWTHGGTLRDIPVGGGSRKNPAKRPRTSSAAAAGVSSSCHQPPALISSASVPFIGCEAMRQSSNNANVCGSFTSLLNNAAVHGPGSLALGGFGPGFEDAGFGLGRGIWPFPAMGNVADGGAGGSFEGNTWQMESGEGGFVGGGDCFSSWPELAISTPGSLLK